MVWAKAPRTPLPPLKSHKLLELRLVSSSTRTIFGFGEMIAINAFIFWIWEKAQQPPSMRALAGSTFKAFRPRRFGQAGRRGEGPPRTPSIYATDTWSGWVGKARYRRSMRCETDALMLLLFCLHLVFITPLPNTPLDLWLSFSYSAPLGDLRLSSYESPTQLPWIPNSAPMNLQLSSQLSP